MEDFLAQLYDPGSTNFHRYLAPAEFTKRFGPTVEDYELVKAFAANNGLTITATHSNRLLLDVQGAAKDVQQAFHVVLLSYRHPTEERDFFCPDREPSVDAALPIADISGLSNYGRPRPHFKAARAAGGNGSGPSGAYFGNDFRAAYVPNVPLNGSGQMIGLLEFDGFYQSDITAYASAAGLPGVPTQKVLLDGFDGTPTSGPNSGDTEVSLDIEMAMCMAPGASKIVVFEGGPNGVPNDILNAMASSNKVKQLSCSWGWGGPSATTDNIFKQLAAQGQSFFSASGDSDAYTTGSNSVNGVDNPSLQNAPSSNPYITIVGGTTLTTAGPGGRWSSETVWNSGFANGSYEGSSGGISSYYSIPTWQKGVAMNLNGGSTAQRNLPDVAMVSDNVYVYYGNGQSGAVVGTSCATPLWAGLAALMNEQAALSGEPNVGFINPAVYAIGKSAAYNSGFHDITSGNNTWESSPSQFYAVAGYDLCTGWGTPAGQALIDIVSGVTNALSLSPLGGFSSSGPVGGPFDPTSQTLVLSNSGTAALNWTLVNTSAWLTVSSNSGTLAGGAASQVSVGIAPPASSLAAGIYDSALLFSNGNGGSLLFPVTLEIGQSLVVNGGFETGEFPPWVLAGDTIVGRDVYDAVESAASGFDVVHSGQFGAFLGDSQVASLTQVLATTPGQSYDVSFWLDNATNGAGQLLSVNWNTGDETNNLLTLDNPPAFSWTNFQFTVAATSTNTTLQFLAENQPGYFGLDDVSVTPLGGQTQPTNSSPGPTFTGFAPGTYEGLFYNTTEVSPASSGTIALSITTRSNYSGKLLIGSKRYSLTGRIGAAGSSTAKAVGPRDTSLLVTLGFGASNQITGTVSDGSGVWSSQLAAGQKVFDARTNAAPFSTRYTLVVPSSSNGGPQGNGFGAVEVRTSGIVTLAGALAEGTALTQTANVLAGGQWPVYASLYSGRGVLVGWLQFDTNQPYSGLTGSLSWIRPPLRTAKLYAGGFTNQSISVMGSSYDTSTVPLITLNDGVAIFDSQNWSAPFTNSVANSALQGRQDRIVNNSSNRMTLTIKVGTGLFSGSVTIPGTQQSFPFRGTLLQNANAAYGYFLQDDQSGGVFVGTD